MCIMEAHVNKVLHSRASAILPSAVLKALGRKSCQGLGQDFFLPFLYERPANFFLRHRRTF